MEKRLGEVERAVRQLQQARELEIPIASKSQLPENVGTPEQQRETGTRRQRSYSISELGEVDHSESNIDGMGAMIFTDEEECGFFGINSDSSGRYTCFANSNKVLHPISPS
jgi:hypothetical protein